MPDFADIFISPPDSGLLYAGHYDPVLVSLSVAIAIFASYAALLVSRHVADVTATAAKWVWLAVGGLCLGLGIWAMHFVGMLAFTLPCSSAYDPTLTLLSMIPSVLACTLVLAVISGRTLSNTQLVTGGLLLGLGIGTMHYAGMAAMRLEGLIRYDLKLVGLSVVVAVVLATAAIWLKFRLPAWQMRWNSKTPVISAIALGLAVSGMHYTAMAATYFVREGGARIVDSQIGVTFLAAMVLAASCVIVIVTIVATYVARPMLFSLGYSYRVIGVLVLAWVGIAWSSASYYYNNLTSNLYQQELYRVNQQLEILASNINENLGRLRGIPLVLSRDEAVHRASGRFGASTTPAPLPYEARKQQWTEDKVLREVNYSLDVAATHLQADVIWVLNAAGDCVAASNFYKPDSFVGSNHGEREYFRQARAGHAGHQYAVGWTSGLAGLYYSYPVFESGRFAGAVVVVSNISNFSRLIDQAQAFITDANGVVVLAPETQPESLNPLNTVSSELSAELRHMLYGQSAFEPLRIAPWGDSRFPSAVRIAGSDVPTLLVSRALAEDLITVHVPRPLKEIARFQTERNWFSTLLGAAGSMLILAASAMVLYLRQSGRTEGDLRIAATAFDSNECMMIMDANCVILRVNKAFTYVTGFTAEEVVGQTPRVLKSPRHEGAFYQAMWKDIRRTGSWQGEIWDRRKNGEIYPTWFTITAVKDKQGQTTHYVGMVTDITRRKSAEEEIAHLAFFDPLTHLPNRRLLLDRLHKALATSARSERHGALLFIDLDNFKTLNDTLGHDIGDLLLKEVATRLSTCVREVDTVARLGGDEFVVMLEDLDEDSDEAAAQTRSVAEKILSALNQTYLLAEYEHHSTPSIGITLFADLDDTVEELLKRADLAMYQAKAAGRNTLRFFDPDMQATVNARASMESDLREAVRANQFVLYYQVQVNTARHPIGAEALIRWLHPSHGMVSPASFIPLAEDSGLILSLGQWVLETACAQLKVWAQSPETAHLTLAVNVSQRQFRHPDFVAHVLAALTHSGANPRQLKLELTESLLVDDLEDTIAKMTELKSKGIGFSLDDFGTGYSSLSYLKRLPLDQLKIDQSFVRDVFTDSNDAAIVRTIVALGQSLGLDVIAEGVETEAQRDFLTSQGCHAYQGYLFGRPVPAAEFYLSTATTGA